ncbi:hypothetical protein GCM10028772_12660 [Nocardioides ultimimeridianus]
MLGTVVVVLALVLGGLVTFTLVRGQGTHGDRLAVRSRSIDNGLTLLGDPRKQWDVKASDLLPHAEFQPVVGWYDGELFNPDLMPIGPYLLAEVANRRQGRLVALDSLDGSIAWSHDLDRVSDGSGMAPCWLLDPSHLLCADQHGAQILDPATGAVLATTADSFSYDAPVLSTAGTFYTVIDVPGSPQQHQLAAYSTADLTRTATADVAALRGWDSSVTGLGMSLDGDLLDLIVYGYPRFRTVAFATDGLQQASDTRTRSGWLTVDAGWTITTDDNEFETTTVTRDGTPAVSAAGYTWSAPAGNDGTTTSRTVVNGRIGIGDGLYDLGTGAAVWSRGDFDGTTPTWTADGRQLLLAQSSGYGSGTTTVIDPADGTTEWTADTQLYPSAETRDALVSVDSESDGTPSTLTVRRRSDGDVVWSRDIAGLSDDGSLSGAVVAGQGMAVVNYHRVRGWSGFPQSAADGASPAPSDGGTSYVTDCGSPPTFTPVRSASEYGGISITYRVTAVCPGGQWLSDSQLSVPFEVDGQDYLSGWFDFSGEPYWVPDGGVDLTLTYPFENATAPQRQIQDAIDDAATGGGTVIHVPCTPGPGNQPGTVPADPSYGQDPTVPTTADGDPDATTAQQDEDNALAALKRIAARDKPAVEALDWTAQLSAKKLGTQDDGIVYASYSDILALHLRLRSRYPDALLVFSTEWPGSYGPSSAGFWVTLSGDSMPTAPPVNRWCRSQHRGPGDCWAKRLATSGDPDRNTLHRKPGQ